jgi:hypothetical protein
MRNSGNIVVNLWLWLKAVSWNIVHLSQTYRIRAAERRLIRAARAARNDASQATQPRAYYSPIENSPFETADMGALT